MRQLSVIVFLIAAAIAMAGQSKTAAVDDAKGFTSSIQFGGNANSTGHVFKLDSNVGYDFNRHFGVAVGVPMYFAQTASTSTTPQQSNNGLGNPYVAFHAGVESSVVNYQAVVTGYVPLADSSTGLSTGRFTVDWTNHFDRTWSRVTPFLNLGIGNTITDSRLFDRPFTSLGFNTHVEGGASVAIVRHVSVGASVYAIMPSGQQTLYSKVMNPHFAGTTTMSGDMFQNTGRVKGDAEVARDHGASCWVGVSPNRYVNLEVGYTRSANYDLNTFAFNLGVNVGRLYRDKSHR